MAEIAKSYFSLHINSESDASAAEFNVFDTDNYPDDTIDRQLLKSSDITYDSSDGKITFGESGTYLIIVQAYVEHNESSGTESVDVLAKINGTQISYVEPFTVVVGSTNKHKGATYHFMKTVSLRDF